MKRTLLFLYALLIGISGAWAQQLSSSTIAKSGSVTDSWDIKSSLPTNNWTAMDDATPTGVTALGSYTAYCRTQNITLSDEGALFITFLYSAGNHQLEILGVDLLNSNDEVVRSDYHYGKTGTFLSHNVYMLDHIASGNYKIRFIINSGVSNSKGNITVKHINIKTANSYENITNWYFVRMHSNQTHYMYYDKSERGIAFNASKQNNAHYLWGFVKDTDGIKIYNKAAGSSVAIDNAIPCALSASGQTFTFGTGSAGSNGAAAGAYFSLYVNPDRSATARSYLNYQSSNIARWNSDDAGSAWMIDETTISAPFVSASEGKIYKLQAYFSDSDNLYFTNNGTNLAFNTSASSGVNDYWILRSSGNGNYPWRFESGRGDGKFLSNKSKTEGLSEKGVYLQINNIDSYFNLRGSNSGDAITTGTSIVNLGTWTGGKSGFGAYGEGGCWSSDGNNDSGWSTKYTIEEVTGVDIYTVVSNINAGGVNKTTYTGKSDQTNGGFYILASAPSATDFTALTVSDYTAGEVVVDATAKTITVNYTANITYTLNWSDGTQLSQVADVTAYLNASSSEFLPSAMANDFVTLSYSPETITGETTEVTVTATWNGPFQLSSDVASAKWYTVGIHSSHEGANYIWKYDGDKLKAESVATDAYHLLNDANCFAFFGNPYTGINIYNKSAAKYVVKANDETQATFDATGTNFIPRASSVSGKTIANGYSCFLVSDGTFYLNCHANDNYKVKGWNDNDAGSTCWFIPAGQYYLNYIDGLALEAPVGAVGTSSYFTTVANAAGAKSTLTNLRSTIAGALYSDMATLATVNNQLDPVRNAGTFALTDGYYRVISAVPGFNATAAWYYNPAVSTTNIVWAKDATTAKHQVNSIFKFTANEDKWNIYSPNAQQSITTGNGKWDVQNAALGEAAPLTVTSIGAAQYTLLQSNNAQTLHAGGHQNGSGTNGNLITWNSNGQGEASAWYIVKVDELPLTLNDGGDGNFYATLCLPFTVTLDGCNAYTMTLSGDFLVPSEAITSVPAGTPVLLRGTTAKATAQIAAAAATGAPLTTTALTGSYVPTPASEGLVGGQNVYTLGKVDDEVGFYRYMGTSIRANAAYLLLDASSQVRGFRFDFGGTDAITHVVAPTKPDAPLYDVQGRRVGNATHGIYIQNGKKILK